VDSVSSAIVFRIRRMLNQHVLNPKSVSSDFWASIDKIVQSMLKDYTQNA